MSVTHRTDTSKPRSRPKQPLTSSPHTALSEDSPLHRGGNERGGEGAGDKGGAAGGGEGWHRGEGQEPKQGQREGAEERDGLTIQNTATAQGSRGPLKTMTRSANLLF